MYKETTYLDFGVEDYAPVSGNACVASITGFDENVNGSVCLQDDLGLVVKKRINKTKHKQVIYFALIRINGINEM